MTLCLKDEQMKHGAQQNPLQQAMINIHGGKDSSRDSDAVE